MIELDAKARPPVGPAIREYFPKHVPGHACPVPREYQCAQREGCPIERCCLNAATERKKECDDCEEACGGMEFMLREVLL